MELVRPDTEQAIVCIYIEFTTLCIGITVIQVKVHVIPFARAFIISQQQSVRKFSRLILNSSPAICTILSIRNISSDQHTYGAFAVYKVIHASFKSMTLALHCHLVLLLKDGIKLFTMHVHRKFILGIIIVIVSKKIDLLITVIQRKTAIVFWINTDIITTIN